MEKTLGIICIVLIVSLVIQIITLRVLLGLGKKGKEFGNDMKGWGSLQPSNEPPPYMPKSRNLKQ